MRARLLLLLAAAVAAPAWAAELNVITGLELKDTGTEVQVSIKGSQKPSFTTFSMADPPRFVLDFTASKFEGIPEESSGAGGVVQTIKALSYGADASAIARIVITFALEVDLPTVEDAGTTLVVRVAKPAGAGAAVATAPAAAPAADAAAVAAAAKAEADAKAKAEADAKARAEADAKARAEADAKAKAEADAKAKAEADAKAKAEADAKAKAEADAKAKAQADAKAKAEADARPKAGAGVAAGAAAGAAVVAVASDSDAKARAEEERRQAQALADADARAKADAEAQAKGDAEKRQAQAWAEGDEDQAALQAEIAAARAGKSPKETPASGPVPDAEAEADQRALEAEIAAARAEAAGGRSSAESLSPQEPMARIREVGFRQLPDASRVFVRTSAPTPFSIQDVDERTVRIEIQNARAVRYNDLRFLDTSFFPSAVQMVTPSRQGSSYVLTVKLRQRVPYQQRKEGDMLAVDFQRPPATAAAARPPGGAPDSGAPGETPVE